MNACRTYFRCHAALVASALMLPATATASDAPAGPRLDRAIIVAGEAGSVAAYAVFANDGPDDQILRAECSCADQVELHLVDRTALNPAMVNSWPLALPGQSTTAIAPPGVPRHMMAVNLRAPLVAGQRVTIRFHLASGRSIEHDFAVVPDSRAAWQGFDARDAGVAQLRHSIGSWDVTTSFLDDTGRALATFQGSYDFAWAVPDRVVRGTSSIPALQQTSAILFFVREATAQVEMLSVGRDGMVWTMTGPWDSEVRETPVVSMPDGSTLKLRFTRSNVTTDRFESRMERSSDGGQTWFPGNHQLFVRRTGAATASD